MLLPSKKTARAREVVVDRPLAEASALLPISNRALLAAHGWDCAFWACSDEARVEEALAAFGRPQGQDEWEVCRFSRARAVPGRKTEDCEAMARHGGWAYVFGSHFGPKGGPLAARRQFVARFREEGLAGRIDESEIEIEVSRGRFRFHRLVNDALRASGLDLIERGEREAKRFVRRTRKKGKRAGKAWAGRVEKGDWPVNLEGATFTAEGRLLLGLRYPVTRAGQPIVLELAGLEGLFDAAGKEREGPRIAGVWAIENVGSPEEPRGVRALETVGEEIHVVTGNLDSDEEDSLLLAEHPEARRAASRHHRFAAPAAGSGALSAERVRALPDETKIEGFSLDADGNYCYLLDDEKIRLLFVPSTR